MFVMGWALCHRHLQKSTQHPFLEGYLFGIAYFFSSLYWIGLGICTWGYHEYYAYGISFILSLFLSVFIAFPLWFGQKIPSQYRYLSYPIFIAICEMVRGLFFPWNYPSYILCLKSLQIIRFVPIDIINLMILIVCFSCHSKKKRLLTIMCGLFFANYMFGSIILSQNANHYHTQKCLNVRLIQPCIPQNVQVADPDYIDFLLQLTTLKGDKDIDVVIWPECSLNIALNKRPDILRDIFSAIPKKTSLVMSGIFIDPPKIYNSLYVLDNHDIKNIYHKYHLVPFGEFIPLRHINPFPKITSGSVDYTPGDGHKILKLRDHFFFPSICYEIIFPMKTKNPHGMEAKFIINVTNDGWFGRSQGPYQHLKIAQVRAIELAIPMIRCCNTGISCIIDSKGRIESRLDLMNTGYIDHEIKITAIH